MEGYEFIKEQSSFSVVTNAFLKIMPKMRISFLMIVFEGEDYLEANLKQIYPHAHRIVIAEGAVELMAKVKGYYRSKDKTCHRAQRVTAPSYFQPMMHPQAPGKQCHGRSSSSSHCSTR